MTRKTYCGNLLWQSILTLSAHDERKIDAVRQVWALANESAEAKQSLNTRMTFAVALRYGKPVLDQAEIATREEFARIRHAISCRESRAQIKALEATRTAASSTRTCAPATRTCAPEDLPRSPVHKSGENGEISSMKYGATRCDNHSSHGRNALRSGRVWCYDGVPIVTSLAPFEMSVAGKAAGGGAR